MKYPKADMIQLDATQLKSAEIARRRLKLPHLVDVLRLALTAGLEGRLPVRKSRPRGGRPRLSTKRLRMTAEMFAGMHDAAREHRLQIRQLYRCWLRDFHRISRPVNPVCATSQVCEDLNRAALVNSETISAQSPDNETLRFPGQGGDYAQTG